MKTARIAEVAGEYGPVTVPERLVQAIWARGDFAREGVKTLSGKRLEVRRPGVWNHAEGPDFRGAELVFDGHRVEGDVEVHFYAEDWRAHGHGDDPNFGHVVLHVLLFPTRQPRADEGFETLVLLPLLDRDIESYALDYALESDTNGDGPKVADWLALPAGARRQQLFDKAAERWEQKVRHARFRLEQAGSWEQALHESVMEALGYRRNRQPMRALARNHTVDELAEAARVVLTQSDECADRRARLGLLAERYFIEQKKQWRLAGLRPANHPRLRIEQYLALLAATPNWAAQVMQAPLPTGGAGLETREFRRKRHLTALRRRLAQELFAGEIGGTRLDTLITDVLLPLRAAHTGALLAPCWSHWFPGDVPDGVRHFLRDIAATEGRSSPLCNGLLQGALQSILDGTIPAAR